METVIAVSAVINCSRNLPDKHCEVLGTQCGSETQLETTATYKTKIVSCSFLFFKLSCPSQIFLQLTLVLVVMAALLKPIMFIHGKFLMEIFILWNLTTSGNGGRLAGYVCWIQESLKEFSYLAILVSSSYLLLGPLVFINFIVYQMVWMDRRTDSDNRLVAVLVSERFDHFASYTSSLLQV